MFLYNGKKIEIYQAFAAPDGRKRVNLRDPEERARYGVVEVPDPVRKDDRFYIITEDAAGNLSHTPRDLDQCRAIIHEKINAWRDELRLTGGVKVGANWFKSTDRAVGEYTTMVTIAGTNPNNHVIRNNWRTLDKAKVPMTVGLVKQILTDGFAQLGAIDDAAEAHKAAVAALTDVDAIAAYNYSTGWPETYKP